MNVNVNVNGCEFEKRRSTVFPLIGKNMSCVAFGYGVDGKKKFLIYFIYRVLRVFRDLGICFVADIGGF